MPQAPFRISMRTLLIATTAFAVWCAALSIAPAVMYPMSQILIGAISLAFTTCFAAGLLFAQGDQRAFCLGALLMVSSMWTGIGGQFMNGIHRLLPVGSPWNLLTDLLIILFAAAVNGWVCVRARRYFQQDS